MPESRAIVTLGDDTFQPITDQTFPFIEKYAKRHGANFIALRDRKYPDVNICYEKFRLEEFLASYDRVLYVDGDVLIRPDAPDIFTLVPQEQFAAMDEAAHIRFWSEGRIRDQFEPYGWEGPWNGIHFNAGVMLLSKAHRGLFRNKVITDKMYWDQPYFNVAVLREKIPFFSLPKEWNFLAYHKYKDDGDLLANAWFIHFSGSPDFDRRARDIAATISNWSREADQVMNLP